MESFTHLNGIFVERQQDSDWQAPIPDHEVGALGLAPTYRMILVRSQGGKQMTPPVCVSGTPGL